MLKQLLLFMLIASFAISANANDAETVNERQRLESVVQELSYLQKYLQETKTTQKLNVRSRFDYQRINADIELLKHGIGEYLNDVSTQPKGRETSLGEINGAYQQ